MISRITLFSFLLALMIPAGIRLWSLGRWDDCSAYLAGDARAPPEVYVQSGDRTIVVPCGWWLPRQTMGVQIWCLAEFAVVVVFLLHVLGDLRAWMSRRRGLPRLP